MRFTISEPQAFSVLVPSGTRITDASSTLIWETIEDAYVEAGETYVDVEARCQTTGTAGNGYVAGQINAIVDLFAYYQSCANVNESDGGSDIPTDEEYYKLMRASMDAYSCAGARGAYIYWAMQVSTEIADVIANSPTPGIVKVYVLMKGGTLAGEEIKGKVLAACSADEVRPLTDWVSVEDAEIVPYDIDLTYYVHQHASQSPSDAAHQDGDNQAQAGGGLRQGHSGDDAGKGPQAHKAGVAQAQLPQNAHGEVQGDSHNNVAADRHQQAFQGIGNHVLGHQQLEEQESGNDNAIIDKTVYGGLA